MTTRPPIPEPPHQGGCLCGKVRYSLNARPLAVNACHCTDCQKLTGATNFLVVIAPSEPFTSTGETQSYIKKADSGRELDIRRCPNCGSRLWHHNLSNPALVFIAAGTLDDPSWVVPTSHIWVKRAAPSVLIQDDALVVDGPPAERALLFEAFDRLYPPR
ncbi:MAG: GFA family protein [Alphaproteobacteria bacterium]|nr:GFA family protein [Alphaproteobacteria bacterium]